MYQSHKKIFVFLFSLLGMSGAITTCPQWRDILPCRCSYARFSTEYPSIICDKMNSFNQVVDIFRGHFSKTDRIILKLEQSTLEDLPYRGFRELNVTIKTLGLNFVNLRNLNDETFDGLESVTFISLADSPLQKVPNHLWRKMPRIGTADLGRTNLSEITSSSFRDLHEVKCIAVPSNVISRIDRDSFPVQLERLHLGRNKIRYLNDSLTGLRNMIWLFINENELEDVEGQLPIEAPDLKLLHANGNRLTRVPTQVRNYPSLESLYLNNNLIESLDGALSKNRKLARLYIESNAIRTITSEDFTEMVLLDTLMLSNNRITTLNGSLSPLRSLCILNLSFNLLTTFSFQEIMGLEKLKHVDLSYNQISQLTGSAANLVEPNIKISDLKLDHNELETLNSALSGLTELLRLDLSHNRIRRISPDDFINLDQLRLLDISHNQITTLDEMSKTYLPRLQELKATHNYLTILKHDFHGLPVLCDADLSSNQIIALSRDLVTKTRCKVDHGVHVEVWGVLKILLQDNPILCDAALPEIQSTMESNHTRIIGVTKNCPPLSEQPVTPRPNGYLGYVPEQTTSIPTVLPPIYGHPTHLHEANIDSLETPNNIQSKIYSEEPSVELRTSDQYHTIDRFIEEDIPLIRQPRRDEAITTTLHKLAVTDPRISTIVQDTPSTQINLTGQVFDPVVQEKVISKLASEIEELRTKIEQISTQNEMLLNKTIMAVKSP